MKINIIYTFLILAFISGISTSCQKETNLTVSGKELVVTASIAPAGTQTPASQTPGTADLTTPATPGATTQTPGTADLTTPAAAQTAGTPATTRTAGTADQTTPAAAQTAGTPATTQTPGTADQTTPAAAQTASAPATTQTGTPATPGATTQTPGTKVSYTEDIGHDLKPSWQIGDIIIGFDDAATPNTYGYHVVAVGNDGKADLSRITAGEFRGTATKEPSEGTTLYMFYAPGMRPSDIDLASRTLAVSIAYQDTNVVPALMMAKGTVTDNHLLLHFTNQTAIFGLKNPTMAHAGAEYTTITLSGQDLCTEVVFSLDGTGNLQTSCRKPGTVTKAVNFTSDPGTKKGPAVIYIVACPLSTATVLTFKANTGENFRTATPMSITRNNYYYSSPTFGQDETIEFESLVKNDEML